MDAGGGNVEENIVVRTIREAVLGLAEESEESSSSSSSSSSSDTDSEVAEKPTIEEEHLDDVEEDVCQPCNEDAPIKRPRNPTGPTPEEKEKHWATHLPYRSWCPICVKARGREDPHRGMKKKEDVEELLPRISMDYAEVGNEQDGKDARKLLVGRDRQSKFTFCHLVSCKGLGDDRIVKKVLQSIRETGNTNMLLKTDGEPAIVQLQEQIITEREHKTIPQNPPAYDPQANGEAERAVQEVKAQLRAIKLGLEARIGEEVQVDRPILEWMIPHAGQTINRFQVGEDGRTAHYRLHMKNFGGKTFEFGEQVLAKPKRRHKLIRHKTLDAKFREATWVGYAGRSAEHLVVLQEGGPAIKVRTVRPRPTSERWSAEAIKQVVATPDAPNPKDPNQTVTKSERETKGLDFGAKGGQDLPKQRVQMQPDLKREFRITERLLTEYGFTAGCRGCEAKLMGQENKPHSHECRARLEEAMRDAGPDEDILERRDARLGKAPEGKTQRRRGEQRAPDTDAGAEHTKAAQKPDMDMEGPKRKAEVTAEPEGRDQPAKKQRIEAVARRQRIEASVRQVMEDLLRAGDKAIGALCTREAVTAMVDELDQMCTRKMMKKLAKSAVENKSEDQMDVAEVFSPPRMTSAAAKRGYKPGFAMDLTTCDDEGKPWDLSCPIQQKKALQMQDKQQPWVLMACPPCKMFSLLQNLSFAKRDDEKVRTQLKEAIAHIGFAVLMCLRQARAGRKFIFEHPVGATSWRTGLLNKLFTIGGGGQVSFDLCRFGMTSEDEQGKGKVRKRTRIVSNSMALLEELSKHQCTGDHRHVHLMAGRAQACQRYPEEFCDLVCEVVMKEKNLMGKHAKLLGRLGHAGARAEDVTGLIGNLEKTDPHAPDDLYKDFKFFDDVTGRELDHGLAVKARRLEMDFFRKMRVYDKVPREAAARDGCRVISTRWLDINKGDLLSPNYRARLVGRELKMDSRLDLFAATPPLEMLRLMCSICAGHQKGKRPYRIMTVDVKRAYFYARSRRPIYIEIPVEDYEAGDEHMVGRLNLSLYGTRDAAQNWTREYTEFLEGIGFKVGLASPCNFWHKEKELHLTVHGDDFTITGPEESLRWLRSRMEQKFEISTHMLGPDKGMEDEVRVLNRTLRWTEAGITYEPDQRHAELIVEELGLTREDQEEELAGQQDVSKEGTQGVHRARGGSRKRSNPVGTPAVAESREAMELREASKEMERNEATRYRGLAARLNYLSLDRPDLQFAAKLATRHMAAPREVDWAILKRAGRYLMGVPRAVQTFRWQEATGLVTTFTDSDWAGDRESRKSTSGGVVCIGLHMIKSWCSAQQIVALSSGEAELYALVKGAGQTKGIMSMLRDFGMEFDGKVCTDASAAIGISFRKGLGRTRHIDVQYLWIQEEIAEGRLKLVKVNTKENPADLLTKALPRDTIYKHLHALDIDLSTTRAREAPELT